MTNPVTQSHPIIYNAPLMLLSPNPEQWLNDAQRQLLTQLRAQLKLGPNDALGPYYLPLIRRVGYFSSNPSSPSGEWFSLSPTTPTDPLVNGIQQHLTPHSSNHQVIRAINTIAQRYWTPHNVPLEQLLCQYMRQRFKCSYFHSLPWLPPTYRGSINPNLAPPSALAPVAAPQVMSSLPSSTGKGKSKAPESQEDSPSPSQPLPQVMPPTKISKHAEPAQGQSGAHAHTVQKELPEEYRHPLATMKRSEAKRITAQLEQEYKDRAANLSLPPEYEKEILRTGIAKGFVVAQINQTLGRGVFVDPAGQPIEKNALIGLYSGKIELTHEDRDVSPTYLFSLSVFQDSETKMNMYIDVVGDKEGNFVQFVNHTAEVWANVTAEMVKVTTQDGSKSHQIAFFAKKRIPPGNQLLVCYQDAYWDATKVQPETPLPSTYTIEKQEGQYQVVTKKSSTNQKN